MEQQDIAVSPIFAKNAVRRMEGKWNKKLISRYALLLQRPDLKLHV